MQSKPKEIYSESQLSKILNYLFSENFSLVFFKSYIGKSLSFICLPQLSFALTVLSVLLFFYEGFVSRFVPISISVLPSVLLLTAFVVADKTKLKIRKFHFWYLAFLLILFVSALFGVAFGVPKILMILGLALFGQFFIAILLGQALKNKLNLLIFSGLPAAGFGIYQFASKAATPATWFSNFESGGTRAFAFFASPNVLGILGGMFALVSLALFFEKKSYIYLLSGAVYFMAMIFTLSRSAWIGFFSGAIFLVLAKNKRLFYFAPLALVLAFVPKIKERILAALTPNYWHDSYLDGRIWSVINGWYLTLKKPFVGWGPGSYGGQLAASYGSPVYLEGIQNGYTALYFTDNQFVEIAVQSGFIGLIAFLGFIISTIIYLLYKKKVIVMGILSAFICFVISGMFANVLEFGALSVPLGLMLGAAENE